MHLDSNTVTLGSNASDAAANLAKELTAANTPRNKQNKL
jgi:hypothetical protein